MISWVIHAFGLVLIYMSEDGCKDNITWKISVIHPAAPGVLLFCFNLIFLSSVIFYWTDTETCNLIINPLTLRSDQDRISPYNINSMSRRQVIRIKRNISQAINSWSNTKISKLMSWELYSRHWGELLMWSGSERVKLFLILIHNQK